MSISKSFLLNHSQSMCQEEESTYLPEIIWFYLLMENAEMKPMKGFTYITLG